MRMACIVFVEYCHDIQQVDSASKHCADIWAACTSVKRVLMEASAARGQSESSLECLLQTKRALPFFTFPNS